MGVMAKLTSWQVFISIVLTGTRFFVLTLHQCCSIINPNGLFSFDLFHPPVLIHYLLQTAFFTRAASISINSCIWLVRNLIPMPCCYGFNITHALPPCVKLAPCADRRIVLEIPYSAEGFDGRFFLIHDAVLEWLHSSRSAL